MRGSTIVDTDPGLGLFGADVDDALAIVHLAAWGVGLAGLTTCFGNATLPRVTMVAQQLGTRFDVPVYAGASGPGDVHTEAVDRLVAHKGTVLAIAPMTNIAAALERGARWERLVVLGGTDRRLPNLRPLHTTELNLAVDEPAARVALAAATHLVPMEVCRTVWFRSEDLADAPSWLRRGSRSWLRTSVLRTGRRAFHPWDLLAAMWVTHPDLFGVDRARPVLASRRGWRGRIAYRSGDTRIMRSADTIGLRATWQETLLRLR